MWQKTKKKKIQNLHRKYGLSPNDSSSMPNFDRQIIFKSRIIVINSTTT